MSWGKAALAVRASLAALRLPVRQLDCAGEEAQVPFLPCSGTRQCSGFTVVCGDGFCQGVRAGADPSPVHPNPISGSGRWRQCYALLSF